MPADNESVNDLLKKPPRTLLDRVQQQYSVITCSEQWRDLAYACSLRVDVDRHLTRDDFEALATVAVLIRDRFGEICANLYDRAAATFDAMALRVVLINKLGAESGHPARDPLPLEDWFFRRLTVPFEKVASMSKDYRSLSADDFLQISSLKDRVRLMKSLHPQHVYRRIDELKKWYGLLDASRA